MVRIVCGQCLEVACPKDQENHCMWACLHRKLRVSRIQVHIFVSTVQTRTAAKSFLDGIAGIKAAVSEVCAVPECTPPPCAR